MDRKKALDRLNEILNCRHQIAHTGQSKKTLDYDSNFEDMKFLYNLAAALQFGVFKHISEAKGDTWDQFFMPPKP